MDFDEGLATPIKRKADVASTLSRAPLADLVDEIEMLLKESIEPEDTKGGKQDGTGSNSEPEHIEGADALTQDIQEIVGKLTDDDDATDAKRERSMVLHLTQGRCVSRSNLCGL